MVRKKSKLLVTINNDLFKMLETIKEKYNFKTMSSATNDFIQLFKDEFWDEEKEVLTNIELEDE